MSARSLRSIEVLALSISIVVTILVMLCPSGCDAVVESGTWVFLCWAISPYIVFFVLGVVAERLTPVPQAPFIACIVSLLMLAFTLLAYIGTLEGDKSSTSGLIFLFIPLYLYMGSFALLVGGLVLASVLERRKGGNG